MKTENRERHRWGEEDEYNISQCEICGCYRGKKANVTYSMRKMSGIKGKWFYQYSMGGTKWVTEHLPCV